MHTVFPFDTGPANEVCREFLERDMAGARLSASFRAYYLLRRLMPLPVRQFLQRRRNGTICASPDWYLPQEFCERLSVALHGDSPQAIRPWPNQAELAFVLTHDVETAEGLQLIEPLAEIEEELGFRSSWNIVPHKYAIDRRLIDDLRERGFEIGIHGYNHDGKLFWSEATFRSRARAINAALERYQAVGFRAPMAHRNLRWMQLLDIEYDSSCFDIDPFQAMPGGIGSLWPVVTGKFVELPYTLPQDHTLLIGLGETTDRIWVRKLSVLKQWSGMALMLTHPDYLDTPQRQELYRGFLTKVRDAGGYWHALPRDVARWWRTGNSDDALESVASRVPSPRSIAADQDVSRSPAVFGL